MDSTKLYNLMTSYLGKLIFALFVCVVVGALVKNVSAFRQRTGGTAGRVTLMVKQMKEQELTEMVERTKNMTPFTATEISNILASFRNIAPDSGGVDYELLEDFVKKFAHRSHKLWEKTEEASRVLQTILSSPSDPLFKTMFKRFACKYSLVLSE